TSSFKNSNETLPSYNNNSIVIDNYQISRNIHFIKHSKTNRVDGYVTSLKRRVRQQQWGHNQNQVTTFQETNLQVPSSINLLLVSYPEQPVSPCPYQLKTKSRTLPLLPLINNKRTVRTRAHEN
ncbi:unnamed protein product, partial [Rotaria sp. Silwood2]